MVFNDSRNFKICFHFLNQNIDVNVQSSPTLFFFYLQQTFCNIGFNSTYCFYLPHQRDINYFREIRTSN